jgi:hypothetical protein
MGDPETRTEHEAANQRITPFKVSGENKAQATYAIHSAKTVTFPNM